MLYIRTARRCFQWHVGEPLPKFNPIDGRVIHFQADGHELNYLVAVMRESEERAYKIGVEGEKVLPTPEGAETV